MYASHVVGGKLFRFDVPPLHYAAAAVSTSADMLAAVTARYWCGCETSLVC